MLRRPPTTITLTSDDIAAYDRSRARRLAAAAAQRQAKSHQAPHRAEESSDASQRNRLIRRRLLGEADALERSQGDGAGDAEDLDTEEDEDADAEVETSHLGRVRDSRVAATTGAGFSRGLPDESAAQRRVSNVRSSRRTRVPQHEHGSDVSAVNQGLDREAQLRREREMRIMGSGVPGGNAANQTASGHGAGTLRG